MDVRSRLRALVSAASLGMMNIDPGVARARRACTTAFGAASLITTVLSSGAVIETIGAAGFVALSKSERWLLLVRWRSQLATTSLASTLRPLTGATGAKWALGLILAVIVSLSGESSHDSTTSPSTSPFE